MLLLLCEEEDVVGAIVEGEIVGRTKPAWSIKMDEGAQRLEAAPLLRPTEAEGRCICIRQLDDCNPEAYAAFEMNGNLIYDVSCFLTSVHRLGGFLAKHFVSEPLILYPEPSSPFCGSGFNRCSRGGNSPQGSLVSISTLPRSCHWNGA